MAERSARAAASLSRYLQPLAFTDWSAVRVTAEITRRVVAWGVDHGWRVRREVPSIAGLPGVHSDRPGYLDVVCERLNGPPIAIEIDRTDKQWSSRKLLCEADAGAVAVWVRWNDAKTWIVPAPIGVVRLPTTRRKTAGRLLYSRTAPADESVLSIPAPRPAAEDAVALSPPTARRKPAPQRCSATTNKGRPCLINARPSGLCHVHDPAVQCGAVKKNGQRCTNATGGGRCQAHRDAPTYPDAPTLI